MGQKKKNRSNQSLTERLFFLFFSLSHFQRNDEEVEASNFEASEILDRPVISYQVQSATISYRSSFTLPGIDGYLGKILSFMR